MAIERLQKIVSAAGIASRRKAEQMIVDGRVTVNGAIITELGSKADLDHDHIKVDGKLLHRPKNLVYLAMNKPVGYVTTVNDPEGRETVMDLLQGLKNASTRLAVWTITAKGCFSSPTMAISPMPSPPPSITSPRLIW